MNPTLESSIFTDQGVFVHHVAWTPTSNDSWKLNFACCTTQLSNTTGAGCLLRDQNAVFKAACAAPLKDCESITMAELIALHHGLDIAVTQGVDYLEVEGDFSIVFQLLQGQILPLSSSTETLLEDCVQYFRRFRSLKVRQIKHGANAVAKKIAALSIGLAEPGYWFDKPPSDIAELLFGDVVGRWVPVSHL